jgi:hypothetical protein
MAPRIDPALALEAKAIVALAFRNGPIEELHAGRTCPTCNANVEYSRISDEEMKTIMKAAVNQVYKMLWQRAHDSNAYLNTVSFGLRNSHEWDDPEV